mmetsp:Transcript_6855/g.14794  ORF Transcript_6855/g.14794 Transcript_6855/m.14794 type:complete len:394 (-) Transcript_6855:115-1296(-)|eukprot:CAMPEP_0113300844 /NCGR_PEP_ID=MMETSP0010_2-20120614/2308_1 /TAXON_ID=216773 ORGANISM="Corethron hystrix, Strain 308" /NCGR_SAMPLE_ID=MMETSP0010_2 /ASSEMBLY_ACC=CAM_ASM_000155 /LENGTH=393 /DNA_ID=CAMNT_0000154343 /DNA_START=267 /DNA_END=1448 /DNA_ORIENTATION=- /assembly_acc=CAM_ASM_000155
MNVSAIAIVLLSFVSSTEGFNGALRSSSRRGPALKMSIEKYGDELRETASRLVKPGKGLLACDESTGTVGTRLESIGMENTEENRADWRELLFTTKGLGEYISGAILFDETLYQDTNSGTPMIDIMAEQGIIPGIKVDTGLKPLCGAGSEETWCSGLDGLFDRCSLAYARGARFAKWRTAVRIDEAKGYPSDLAVKEAAWGLARYARVCQECGLVPIVEPEVLIDGTHKQEVTAKVQERFISTVYKFMEENNCMLEGTLLKPSMTVSGVECENKPSPEEVAAMTVQTLQRVIPPAMPGVTFLSGGISEEDASIYLNEINKIDRQGPWALTFSFSRAMQSSCIKIWGGKPENKEAAQAQLLARAQANSEASKGEYKAGSQPSIEESLYVKNYVY